MAPSKQSAQGIAHQAKLAYRSEDFARAILLYRKALKLDKNDPELLRQYGHVLTLAGYTGEAIEVLDRACKRRANHPPTLLVLAFAKLRKGDVQGVHETLDRALIHDPTHGAALLAKVNICTDSGTPELAAGLLDEALAAANPDPLVFVAQAKLARSTKEFGVGIDAVNRVLENPKTSEKHKVSARFALGHLLDATGEYDKAFEIFRLANSTLSPASPTHASSTIDAWSESFLAGLESCANQSDRLVIVVGMPRSGTTLTEQIIAAHPLGATVGEAPMLLQQSKRTTASNITTAILDGYVAEYLAYLESEVGNDASRVVDKHMNADKTLGMISKMFPRARFVHCLREAADCCLSAYFQNFGPNLPYARDLKTLGHQYVAHRKLMDHWNDALDRPIFANVYEELVDNPDTQVRAMLTHLDLPFDESCLRFHESKKHVLTASAIQVRKPIYSSSKQRWKNYRQHLGPLLDALGPYAPL